MPYYAIVFTRDCPPGQHWRDEGRTDPAPGARHDPAVHRPRTTDSDRRQHWRRGEVYSWASVAPVTVPDIFEVVTVDHAPDFTTERWDPQTRQLVPIR